MTVREQLKAIASEAEWHLEQTLASAGDVPPTLREAMAHVVLAGGKRLRPALVVMACRFAGGTDAHAWPGACAVELVHVYSLVHDDMPCMDDDDLRRGQPTVHRRWDEATAVLCGDALQALAFEALVTGIGDGARAADAVGVLARAAGAAGMVAGQVLDLAGEGGPPTLDLVRTIHERKTAALIAASAELGAVLAGADQAVRSVLRQYGQGLGLAFQIVDDCLDETASAEDLGKTVGKDREAGKLTWPACVGVDSSMDQARALARGATEALLSVKGVEMPGRFLEDLALFVVNRRL
ncbi:MAG: hypothetical protein CMJ85_04680 [Planctomycetes bacterium]|jgi:geranylgeranyl pyrophosphate synthase|nr:hypothetical protein [Planctomycetota bacterium]